MRNRNLSVQIVFMLCGAILLFGGLAGMAFAECPSDLTVNTDFGF